MRNLLLAVAFLAFCHFSLAQDLQSNGNSSGSFNNGIELQYLPGLYAAPFIPVLATPNAELSAPNLQVGASNATSGNEAGAQTASSLLTPAPPSVAPRLDGAEVSTDIYPKASPLATQQK